MSNFKMIALTLIVASIVSCGAMPDVLVKEGPAGKDGAVGAVGAKGEAGREGAVGDKGARGDTGTSGKDGAKGDKGDTGASGTTGAKGESSPQSVRNLVKKVEKYRTSIVDIDCGDQRGTGFLSTGGKIVTAAHVLRGVPLSTCEFYSGGTTLIGTGKDASKTLVYATGKTSTMDMAVVTFKKEAGVEMPAGIPINQSYAVETGDEIISLALPYDIVTSVQTTYGNVVDALYQVDEETGSRIMTTDNAAGPGSSGAPILNTAGEVYAIHVAGYGNGLELNQVLLIPANIGNYL